MPVADMLPEEQQSTDYFLSFLAEELAVKKEDILDFELNTYCVEEPAYVGIKETLLSSPRLDNQTSVAALLAAIVEGTRTDGINLIALFDNEEIGNTSKQGAASILLHDMVKRIYRSLGCSEEETDCAMYGGMLLSVDVAHALHPNHKGENGYYQSSGAWGWILYQRGMFPVLCDGCKGNRNSAAALRSE